MKIIASFFAFLIFALLPQQLVAVEGNFMEVSQSPNYPTRYDWSEVSRAILAGKATKMEQAEAIYDWLCQNIAYDTDYKIFHADECYDNRRGVCNAYCELFWQIAKPASLECIVVNGRTKTTFDPGDPRGHSWILCNVGNGWILIDPTWGAGNVNNGVFKRKKSDKSWFNVPPKWMILTHFPKDERYQLLQSPISEAVFESLQHITPNAAILGRWGRELLDKAWNRSLVGNPMIFDNYAKCITIDSAPFNNVLQVGEFYTFRVGKLVDTEITLINNSSFWLEKNWTLDSEGYYNIRFMPREAGTLKLAVKGERNLYWDVVMYQVAEPTLEQIATLENHYPLESPAMKKVKNLNPKAIEYYGINSQWLLSMAKSGKLQSMPSLYTSKDYSAKIVSIPLSKQLKVGYTYTFILKPESSDIQWAVINTGSNSATKWYRNWQPNPNGEILISVTPRNAGTLKISASMTGAQTFYPIIEYEVID